MQTSSRPTLRGTISSALGFTSLLSILLLWPFIGNAAAYICLVFLIPAALLGWRRDDALSLASARWVWMSLASFALLTAAFLLQPGQPSLASIGDFAFFAIAPIVALSMTPMGRSRFSLEAFCALCICSAALAAAVGGHGMTQGQSRVTADSLSPIHFAVMALTFGFMGLGFTLVVQSAWRWLSLVGPLLGIIACVASGTRAAVIVGCALAAVYGLFFVRQIKSPFWVKLLIPVLVALSLVGAFYLAGRAGYTRVFDGFGVIWAIATGDPAIDKSSAFRLEMYRGGVMAFLDAPLFGHGWHEQMGAALPYLSEMALEGYKREGWAYLHNDALSLGVSAGILGLIAFALIASFPITAALEHVGDKSRNMRMYMGIVFVTGIVAGGLTDVLLMVELPKLLLVLVSAVLFLVPTSASRLYDK